MTSQPTDVDRHAFIGDMENAHQSLQRMNSGLSTASRSTIHHVPPSPPSRHAGLPGFPSGSGKTGRHVKDGHGPGSPLLSILDSGYDTDKRRGSLCDLAASTGEQPAIPGSVIPPSTAESAAARNDNGRDDKVGGETVLWGGHPFQQSPKADNGALWPPNQSQQGFMIGDDIPDYEGDSFSTLYQDIMSYSRSSPPEFTFETHSQVE
ncbi:hypothetical protein VTH06DRAFT_3701 [Thermothelomyces fergusii]